MAQLIKVIDRSKTLDISLMPNGTLERTYTILEWHWELVDTSHAEIAYFQSLGDNE